MNEIIYKPSNAQERVIIQDAGRQLINLLVKPPQAHLTTTVSLLENTINAFEGLGHFIDRQKPLIITDPYNDGRFTDTTYSTDMPDTFYEERTHRDAKGVTHVVKKDLTRFGTDLLRHFREEKNLT